MVISEDWDGFAPAFAEAVRPDDAQGRSTKRVLLIGFAAVLTLALGALVDGALSSGRSAAPAHPAAGPTAAGPGVAAADGPAGSTWTAIAGPTCTTSAARFAIYGYYTSTSNGVATGWITSGSGGYSGDGCAGAFVSVPLSGQVSAYDGNRYALWTFRLGAGFSRATCLLATFIPDNPQIADVGGDPADYLVYGTDDSSGSNAQRLGAYQIDQVSARGQWVTAVSFKVNTGWVTVKMVDAGLNQTPATRNAHAAAAQVQLTCHAA